MGCSVGLSPAFGVRLYHIRAFRSQSLPCHKSLSSFAPSKRPLSFATISTMSSIPVSLSNPSSNAADPSAEDCPTLTLTLTSSVTGNNPPVLPLSAAPAPPDGVIVGGVGSPAVEFHNSRAQHAANFAASSAQIASNVSNAHDVLTANHRKLFLQKAFGINPDGSPIVGDDLERKN
jgi:hypothetical protein